MWIFHSKRPHSIDYLTIHLHSIRCASGTIQPHSDHLSTKLFKINDTKLYLRTRFLFSRSISKINTQKKTICGKKKIINKTRANTATFRL